SWGAANQDVGATRGTARGELARCVYRRADRIATQTGGESGVPEIKIHHDRRRRSHGASVTSGAACDLRATTRERARGRSRAAHKLRVTYRVRNHNMPLLTDLAHANAAVEASDLNKGVWFSDPTRDRSAERGPCRSS